MDGPDHHAGDQRGHGAALSASDLILVAFLDASVWNIILAICITAWTSTARIIRSRVQQLKALPLYRLSAPWEPAAPIS